MPKYRRKNVKNSTTVSSSSRNRTQDHMRQERQERQEQDSLYVEPELPSWTKQDEVIDYLSEDDQIPTQKFACVSMLSLSKWRTERQRAEAIENICNKEGFDLEKATEIIDAWSDYVEPKRSFKIRGVYGSYAEAQKRSQYLQRTHKNHNVAISSVGYWVPFDPDPDRIGDQNYMERELNDLHEGYMMNREKGKEHFQEQAAMKAQRARIEGSKWGQEQLLNRKETKQEVEYRVKAAEEDIAQFTEKIKRAQETMEQAQKKLEYMEEHPELVLEEEDTPVDHDNVPEEVMQEIDKQEADDGTRGMLAAIESQRKRPNMGQAMVAQGQAQAAVQQSQTQKKVGEHQMFMEPANLPGASDKGFGDDLILPHQAREEVKKVSEDFKNNVPPPSDPTKPKII